MIFRHNKAAKAVGNDPAPVEDDLPSTDLSTLESADALAVSIGILAPDVLGPEASATDAGATSGGTEETTTVGIPETAPINRRPDSSAASSPNHIATTHTRPEAIDDEYGSQAVDWTRPAPPEFEIIDEPPYEGRVRVGEPGSMIRITPSVRTKIAGPHRPDSVVDAGRVSPALSLGAVSVKGASHHHTSLPRQDAYAFGVEGDWLVVAVGDGVSEGHMSHLAADRAVGVAVSETKKSLALGDGPLSIDWVRVSQAIREAVRSLGVQLASGASGKLTDTTAEQPSDRAIAKQLATTCDVLVARTSPNDDGCLPLVRVQISGDGSFYILDPQRGWGLLGMGKDADGAQIDNSVVPLPMDPGEPTVTRWALEPGQAAIVCTDGFGDVIGRGALPVGRYLFEEWQQPLDTTELLQTASFINMNADDDRSAVILWAAR